MLIGTTTYGGIYHKSIYYSSLMLIGTTTYGGGGFQSSPQLVSPNSNNLTGSNPFATTTANPFQGIFNIS
jgi:hypothetical protein